MNNIASQAPRGDDFCTFCVKIIFVRIYSAPLRGAKASPLNGKPKPTQRGCLTKRQSLKITKPGFCTESGFGVLFRYETKRNAGRVYSIRDWISSLLAHEFKNCQPNRRLTQKFLHKQPNAANTGNLQENRTLPRRKCTKHFFCQLEQNIWFASCQQHGHFCQQNRPFLANTVSQKAQNFFLESDAQTTAPLPCRTNFSS